MFRSMFPRSSSARRARFILSAGANRDARSSDRVHCRTLNTGHTLSQIQPSSLTRRAELDQRRTRRLRRTAAGAARALDQPFSKKDCSFLTVTDQPSKNVGLSVHQSSMQSSPLTPRALPLGRHTERTPTHTPVPPNPAVEPLPASLLYSIFCYE